MISLDINPPFKEFYFIDLDDKKVGILRSICADRKNVHIYQKDCNKILLENIFPEIIKDRHKRGLCLLDPYGLHLDWKVIESAGKSGQIEIFINFPTMGMNREVLWRDPNKVSFDSVKKMNQFWGDNSWKNFAYTEEFELFGTTLKKQPITEIVNEFRNRLKNIARFNYIPEPLPMKNNQGCIIYYLFFASPNKTANKIVTEIFKKYR